MSDYAPLSLSQLPIRHIQLSHYKVTKTIFSVKPKPCTLAGGYLTQSAPKKSLVIRVNPCLRKFVLIRVNSWLYFSAQSASKKSLAILLSCPKNLIYAAFIAALDSS